MKWLLWVVLILFLFPQQVLAEEIYQQHQILFEDNFDQDLSQWLDEGQTNGWSIDNSNLLGSDSGILKSGRLTTSGSWDNYSIELDVNNLSGIDEGIGFRRSDSNNGYEINLRHGNGLFNTPEIILAKISNGQTTILKTINPPSLINQHWYHLKIEVFLTHIQVWLDEQLILEFDDPKTTIRTGGISLSYWTGDLGQSSVRFDNVQVRLLSKHLNPVVFIPGIAGSALQAEQDIIWSDNDGHGGIFSHAYTAGEKLWVNLHEAILPGDDDYFDVLRLKADGQTSAAAISLTGQPVDQGYGQIDPIFSEMGYTKGINYFLLVYDWRKDVMTVSSALDQLINLASQQNNQSQVNLVVHSLGGLVARAYLNDQSTDSKVYRLIEMGVPHLGAPKAAHDVVYGSPLGKTFLGFSIGVAASEVKDVLQNYPSIFQLFPYSVFNQFYPSWITNRRDPNYNFMTGLNQHAVRFAEDLHQRISPNNLPPNIKSYQIAGSSFPTLGQITESWWISWPIKLIPKTDTTYINGDGTVPLYSATLKNDQLDFSNQSTIYFVEENHNQLVEKNSLAFTIVKQILSTGDPLLLALATASETAANPLEGIQLSVDSDAELQIDDPNHLLSLDKTGSTTNLFIKKKQSAQEVKIISHSKNLNIKVRHYLNNNIDKTDYYHQIPTDPEQELSLILDPEDLIAPILYKGSEKVIASTEISGTSAIDQYPPQTNIQIRNSIVTLDTQDTGSGTLKTEYSLDGGQTVHLYNGPFLIADQENQTLEVTSIDKVGNQEMPQTMTLNATATPSPSPSSNPETEVLLTSLDSKLPPPQQPEILSVATETATAIPTTDATNHQVSTLIMISFLYAYLNARRLAGL